MFAFKSKSLFSLGILALLPCFIFATDCTDSNCKNFRIGLGGAYHNLDSKDAQISSVGGYLAFSARGTLKNRLASELGGKVGLGSATASRAYFESDLYSKSNLSLFTDFYFKIGVNIASANVPLFVNAVYGWDNFSTNLKSKGVGLSRHFAGGELEGFLPMGGTSSIEYLAGFYTFLNGDYVFANTNITSKLRGTNFMAKVSVGYTKDINPQIAYYVKLIGKYEDMSASQSVGEIHYPSSKNMIGMLEFGISL